ncbi:N-acetylmuramoyl-L-alanine amidase [Peptoniphilus catoniae]|uniref:N-acetylmuramoyl-L-alanine amidase n=1 Tax=Peptoniphilus catoniae TaxID=1660341 RepID=UPI0015D645B3|nr:N-acetylmuramoyl-L-alanine amidase [Peptoniphilus catoniae]
MKKTILFLTLIILLTSKVSYGQSQFSVVIDDKETPVNQVNVQVDGKDLSSKFRPYTLNGRTFVPIRELTESLGATVNWDNKLKSASINYSDKEIILKINSDVVYINGEKKKLEKDSLAKFTYYKEPEEETKTMVPLRFLSETLGYDVSWDQDTMTASVTTVKAEAEALLSAQEEKKESPKNESEISDNKDETGDLIKDSAPKAKSAGPRKNSFVSNYEKKEMNEINKKSQGEVYKAAGLTIDFENEDENQDKEERVISKKIKPIGRISIMIDPGHGGKDSGAVTESGLKEKDLNLEIAKRLEAKFVDDRYEIEMTRSRDEYVKLLDRANQSNNNDFEIFLSIHINASDNRNAKGIEVLYAHEKDVSIKTVEQKHLANALLKELINETGSNSRGIKNRPDLVVLNKTKAVSALVELGFMTNPQDYENLLDDEYLDKLADGIYKGLIRYLDEYVEE